MLDVLIVEDEINLGKSLLDYLKIKGHNPVWASNIKDAKNLENEKSFDVVLMDIGLPDGSGIDLAKEIMSKDQRPTLLFLSALNDPETKLEGLEIGADDYITKPFNLKELTLRLDRILKNKSSDTGLYQFDGGIFNPKKFEISIFGEKHTLATKENQILKLLFAGRNEVVSREEVIEKVWGADQFPSNRTVDNYIVNLRKLIDKTETLEIQSVRGVGYSLKIKE